MQRRAYAPGLAVLLAAITTTLGGCSAGSGTDSSDLDAKSGTADAAAAPPGRYRTLYEPCGSVSRSRLQELLPGTADLPPEQRDRVLRGTAAVTYDTDRRAGCSWKADGPDASHHLMLDFERVVSYDSTVSDDDRAQEVYAGKAADAGLSGLASPTTAPGTPTAPSGQLPQTVAPSPGTAAPSTGTAGPKATASPTRQGLESRLLTGLGDAAFIDDVLAAAGPAAQERTVSVVFRTSNVIVTVRYGAQPSRVGEVPDSKELQDKAQELARALAERFDE
ncbi:DUF3558 domain-containing protein [Streptomyces coeruleoprunus]|uniref:DUF3558 domain-containing protein n=1 Tax=Streptomyces coeruleoprunus TaxID=285563 RepID=A0ABV9XMP8_9ACTN